MILEEKFVRLNAAIVSSARCTELLRNEFCLNVGK